MRFDWSTFALQIVNFAILVWLLHRFLYRPVLRLVDARRAEVDRQYAAAQAAEDEAKRQLAAVQSREAGIAAERAAMRRQAAAEADAAAAARRARAEREAAGLLESARKILAVERAQAVAETRRAALDLGTEIAGRLLAELPMRLRAEAWLARIEAYLAALPQAERGALTRQLAGDGRLIVVTASALPAEADCAWREALRRMLGDDIAIEFRVDPALIAGAELHFPIAILRFSWQGTLAGLRAEIDAHAR